MTDETFEAGSAPTMGTGSAEGGALTEQRGTTHELRERARESGRDLLDQAVEKKDELKARAGSMLDDGRHQAADRVGSLARALHTTASNLEHEGDRQLSHWVHQAADQVDRVVGYLNGRDPGALMEDMEQMARRNPALFLGGTYAAGMLLGRFLRSSSPEQRAERPFAEDEASERTFAEGTFAAGALDDRTFAEGTFAEDTSLRGDGRTDASWTGADQSGHTTGGRTDESLRRGQDLGGTPGLGASSLPGALGGSEFNGDESRGRED